MIKINGVTIKTPSSWTFNIMDISKADRNSNGTIIIERIATKRKGELSYNYLTKSELATLLQQISSVFFSVEYPDAQTGEARTGTFYTGDRKAGMIMYKNGNPIYKDISFSIIEQ